MLLYIKITFHLRSIAITYLQYLIIFFFLTLFFVFCSIFFSPTDSWFSRWKLTNLNNSPNSFHISLSRLSQKRSCRQMQFFHECPGRYAVYNHRLQSADVSCPNRAKTHRSDYQNHVCNHPKHGRNQQSHLASSETLSNLHRLFSDHRTLQIRPNDRDQFYTLHWSCQRTWRLQRSSCKLKTKWRSNNYYFVFIGLIFFGNAFNNFLTKWSYNL